MKDIEKKCLLQWAKSEKAKQERFVIEQGFTPDCSPYYVAMQYKKRAEIAEKTLQETKALYDEVCRKLKESRKAIEAEIYTWLNETLYWDEEGICGRFAETFGVEIKNEDKI